MFGIHAPIHHFLHSFDTDAYTSFVNKEVTKWLEQRYNNDGVQCAL